MKTEIDVRDGEACLGTKMDSGSLDVLIKNSFRGGLSPSYPVNDRVTKDEPWKSTKESTEVVPVIYLLDSEGNKTDLLIAKRSDDDFPAIFKYRWTP
jgi:hypothetical protein